MTRTLFREFLHWFDDHLKDRKVVLLLDTPLAQRFVSSNSQPQDSRSLGLTNITVIWLPISWMDAYNQLRQEVTGIWKTFYRRYWVQYVCNQLSAHQNPLTTMNILKAVSWACRAWHIDVGSRNIRNCSRRSGWLGIFSADQAEEDEEEYKAAKQQLRDTVEMLAQMNFLHKAMEIDTFISPPFESPEGAWIEEEQMQTQTGSVEIPEGDSDEEVV
ncbi:hypothetical protein IFM46972_01159 [Aspergillus udagawae]|uniref:DDE-1 domain-containing protein n=1 Tax=Aspergillus udagawae TaxID=91492 RepID=A0A8H3N263_9EURO|nr:hypothetical protein IFM46972_01159 [Aspergillus udagawae]